jgi:hypothetical protein
MFFGLEKVSVNSPRFTSNPPQLHHQKTTLKNAYFGETPCKNAL